MPFPKQLRVTEWVPLSSSLLDVGPSSLSRSSSILRSPVDVKVGVCIHVKGICKVCRLAGCSMMFLLVAGLPNLLGEWAFLILLREVDGNQHHSRLVLQEPDLIFKWKVHDADLPGPLA